MRMEENRSSMIDPPGDWRVSCGEYVPHHEDDVVNGGQLALVGAFGDRGRFTGGVSQGQVI